MLNQLALVGRVTYDPELKVSDNNIKSLRVQLAVQRTFKNNEGEYDADFISVTIWGDRAENMVKHLNKGDLISVSGRVQSWQYNLEDDKKLNMLEIVAENISFLAKANNKTKEE